MDDQQNSTRRKISNDYVTKHLGTEEDDNHLEMLEDLGLGLDGLGLESTYGKDNLDKDYTTKKPEKNWPATDREKSEGENTDDLLAEIEEYVNSNNPKQPRFSAFDNNYNPPSNASGMYQYAKPSAGTQNANSNIKPPVGMSGKGSFGSDIAYGSKNEGYDKGLWNDNLLGPSSYDLLSKNQTGLPKNKSNGYLPTVPVGVDNDLYKYGNQSNQWSGGAQTNISNRGAQIMNSFVYPKPVGNTGGLQGSNSQGTGLKAKGDLNNMSYGQAIDDGTESYGKYGY